ITCRKHFVTRHAALFSSMETRELTVGKSAQLKTPLTFAITPFFSELFAELSTCGFIDSDRLTFVDTIP
ncbi:TPA: hypothetical protein ACS78A_003778, partial [Providencia alcalifaciens]